MVLLRKYVFPILHELAKDGLVECTEHQVKLTSLGHNFIRNVCSAFDLKLQRDHAVAERPVFSKAV
jgi:oxygen-independent coproporphyrinogen-3 oxidase